MTHLDLDTTALRHASTRTRTAASALTSAPVLGGADAEGALAVSGDPILARALADLTAAWAATRAGLADDLDALAGGLCGAADVFGQAEQTTGGRLAELLAPAAGRDR